MVLTKHEKCHYDTDIETYFSDENGLCQGLYHWYDNDGSLIGKGYYVNDIAVGLWEFRNKEFIYYL